MTCFIVSAKHQCRFFFYFFFYKRTVIKQRLNSRVFLSHRHLILIFSIKLFFHDSILDQTSKLMNLQRKLNMTENDLKVAFSAGLTDSGSVGPFDEERTLIFSKTLINIGQAYDQTAGVFTAPVRGVYFFSFTAADYLKGYMGLYLYWNDQPIMFNLELNDHGGYTSTSNAMALQLEEGDRVRLSLPASYRLYDDNRNFSLFSGFLLFQL
uniref:C1q domain-containing protein n=1 Tax=Acanthochromis polyacanthus TaxID=80966 RepID=A0A3Q1FIA8_9TELE